MTLRDYIKNNQNRGEFIQQIIKSMEEVAEAELDNIYVDDYFDEFYKFVRRPYFRISADNKEGKIGSIRFLSNQYECSSDKVLITDHSRIKYPFPDEIISNIIPMMHQETIITIEITKWNECPDYIWHRREGYSKLWMNDEYRDRFIAKYFKRDTVCIIKITDSKIYIITDKEKINASL